MHPKQRWTRVKEILLVDDDDAVRELVAEVLEGAGYTVIRAANGEDALGHLRSSALPGLIILDFMMPRLSGWELCEIIRADRVLSDIPIVALTATAAMDRESLHLVDLDDSVSKPFDIDDLLRSIERFFHDPDGDEHGSRRAA